MNNIINRTIDQYESISLKEADWVEQARQNPHAFSQVYNRYVEPVYRYIYNRTGNSADAEDITSQTFLAALEGIHKYKDKGYFAAWLFSIARRKTIDYYRSRRNLTTLDEAQFIWEASDMDGNLIQKERNEKLQNLIQALPESERELIRLRYLAELNFAEIAHLLKRNESATKKTFYRLIARIQKQLEVANE